MAGRLPHHRIGYWLTAAAILAVTTWALPRLDSIFTFERNWLFELLAASPTNRAVPGRARLVLINDDDYWSQVRQGKPTDIGYLAQIVRALDKADVSVIALDFDMRTANPGAPARLGDYAAADAYGPYQQETEDLVRAIDDVAQRRKIVLAKGMTGPNNGPFRLASDLYQPFGICVRQAGSGAWDNPGTPEFPLTPAAARNISCGYIALMEDPRQVPPPAAIVGQAARLDSFSMAIVRARDPAFVPAMRQRPYYGAYFRTDLARDARISVPANGLLTSPDAVRDQLQGWPVIVGAAWHNDPSREGPAVDSHETPVGPESGAVIHENLAEAMLGGRVFPGLGRTELAVLEVLVGAISAVFFAYYESIWAKCLAIAGFMLGLLALQWLVLLTTGAFLDAFASVLALGVHTLVDRLLGLHETEQPSRLEEFIAKRWRGIWPRSAGRTADAPSSAGEGQG